MTKETHDFYPYALSDRYTRTEGTVFLTGTQALVRIMLDQARRDKQQGLNTAGFISGYRGSPLGAVDLELWRARDVTKDNNITFMPAVNEDLGATAVLGAQQAVLDPHCEVEGVFSMWYGKGPGVDRSGDALRHGNAYGSSPKGGVLVVAGDDHGCVSSSMPHQSDVAFMTWMMPTLNPANVGEFLEFGAYGLALSRFSGRWVGFKAISETVESGQSVALQPDRAFTLPQITPPPGGLHVRRSDMPSPEIETRLQHKLCAVEAFVEANPIDRRIYNLDNATFGIVTTGKGVTIHTIDCETLEEFVDAPERWLDVSWDIDNKAPDIHVGRVHLTVLNVPGSLGELSTVIARNDGNISNLKITDRSPQFFNMLIDIEVRDVKHLTNVIAALRANPSINSVERARG